VHDFHSHLDLCDRPLDVYAEAVRRNAFTLLVTTSPSAYVAASKLFPKHSNLAFAPGLHPEIAHLKKSELPILLRQIQASPYVGEVGLDGSPQYRTHWEAQLAVFKTALNACAESGGRVISIHSRKAPRPVLDVLEVVPNCGTPILHWFAAPVAELERAARIGCWFSVGPAMLVDSRGRDLAARMPRDRVVAETDGPYADVHGRPLMPWHAESVPGQCARLWGMREADAVRQFESNATALRAVAAGYSLRDAG
jgi:TatD DNase family protein